jgi:protein-S-isoprenylcysteine O-methyltransferase Ste14
MIVGTWITLAGVILVILGCRKIYKTEGLVTDGIYNYVRHPQYTGFLLIIFGWILHWPTLLGLIFLPILFIAFYWLARREEYQLEQIFGNDYKEYKKTAQGFIPHLL